MGYTPWGQENGRRVMPPEQLGKQSVTHIGQGPLIHHQEFHRAAVGLLSGVEQAAGKIRRTQGVVAQLSQLSAQQRTMPLVGHDEQNSRWMRFC